MSGKIFWVQVHFKFFSLSLSFPDTLMNAIKKGNIDDITEKLTPKALTKCKNNALLTAMEVRHDVDNILQAFGFGFN